MNTLRRSAFCSFLFLLVVVFLSSSPLSALAAYQNFTVGDSTGWTYPTKNVIDYQSWANGHNFSLGDFLLFNYPLHQDDVIVTYNKTVYDSCDYLDSNDNDYEVWGEAGTSQFSAIPLVQTGMNYFFSGSENGDHCKGGMKFAVNVSYGEGLPASLMIPPPAPTDNTPTDTPSTDTPSTDTTQTTTPSGTSSVPNSSTLKLIHASVATLLAPFMLLGALI